MSLVEQLMSIRAVITPRGIPSQPHRDYDIAIARVGRTRAPRR